jgi:hypothetical protein
MPARPPAAEPIVTRQQLADLIRRLDPAASGCGPVAIDSHAVRVRGVPGGLTVVRRA